MNHLIIALLFFFLGALVSWVFRSKKIDKQDNTLDNHIKFLEVENKCIRTMHIETTDFLEKTIKSMERSIYERDQKIYQLEQQQEKQKCPG